ncbi:MAG: RHS repeat-associated core domain-containing protein [Bacteroidota bacterium]
MYLRISYQAGYRFGFNGKEKDDEITGVTGSHLNYKFRMYDSRIARFFTVDPITAKYPMLTPYQFASNSPIGSIEYEGLEGIGQPGIAHQYYKVWTQCGKQTADDVFKGQFIALSIGTGIIASGGLIAAGAPAVAAIYYSPAAIETMNEVTAVTWGFVTDEEYPLPAAGDNISMTLRNAFRGTDEGKQIIKSIFDIAKGGGTHGGLYNRYLIEPIEQIQRGINSLQKRITHHQKLIDDVDYRNSYLTQQKAKDSSKRLWNEMSESQQENVLKSWGQEVENYSEQVEVLQGIITEKGSQ